MRTRALKTHSTQSVVREVVPISCRTPTHKQLECIRVTTGGRTWFGIEIF
uniref:Uncharacterized protein n=1 Tax=Anopheles albimanus TaxID=7167 RepID=A0A182FX53_ANOAL